MKGVLADGAGGEVDDKIVMLKYVRAFMGRPWRAATALHCHLWILILIIKWRSWCGGEETWKRGD